MLTAGPPIDFENPSTTVIAGTAVSNAESLKTRESLRDRDETEALSIGMKLLRALCTGWPAVLSFLIMPTLAVFLAPHDQGEWKRWLLIAPLVAAYIWFTWPQDRDEAE